jgi:replicative DNA helicase
MSICSSAIARAADQSEPAIEVLEAAEGQLLEIAQEAVSGKLRTVADSVESAGGIDEYLKPILNPVAQTGLPTGFYDFDSMTGGLKPGELVVIAARPSQGKTGMLANILQNICIGTEAVAAFFSLEMSRDSIERRILASIARVDVRRAMSGQFLSALEKEKLQRAMSDLVESRLFIDDTAVLTPVQMRAKARRLKQREGRLDVLACDYLQLLHPGHKAANRQEEVMYISRALKQCSKELECPVIALAQLNRSNEQRTDKRPVLSDLRESGQIEQDSDLVCFIHRDEYYDRDNEDVKGLADFIVAKSRSGPTGVVKLAFMPEIVRFDNLTRG